MGGLETSRITCTNTYNYDVIWRENYGKEKQAII